MAAELVIRNGTLIDGSRSAARVADVAVRDGLITEVGDDIARGHRELDAEGLLVVPGFVDPHTHYDGQATWDPWLKPSSQHGVTTAVMGNCGVGFAPVGPGRQDWLISMMEGVEDIPGTALHEGLKWDWESYPEYLDALGRQPRVIDIGSQVPHAALRAFVMGDRGADSDQHPDADELAQLERLLRQGLEAGAIGVSTSRTERHRTRSGDTLGTLHAREPELNALACVLEASGRGVFQLLSDAYRSTDEDFVAQELGLISEIARRSGRPLSYTVQQDIEAPDRWRDLMALARSLRAEGLDVKAQVAPRPIGALLGLEASACVFTPARAYGRVAGLPLGQRLAAMADPALRQRIIEGHEAITSGPDAFAGFRFFARFDDMYVLDDPVNYDLDRRNSLAFDASRLGLDPRQYAYDVQLKREGTQLVYAPLFNFVDGDLRVVREMITSPEAMFGLSDAGAHCGQICDASMTTSFVSLWGRDRRDNGGMALEEVVHQLTRRPALHFGYHDRGLLAPGHLADINIIDLAGLVCRPPKVVADLPAGGRRLLQEATGYRFTIKRGQVTFEDGAPTGELPGRLLRGPQAGPV